MAEDGEHASEQGNANAVDFGELLRQPAHHGLSHGEPYRGAGHAVSSLDGLREHLRTHRILTISLYLQQILAIDDKGGTLMIRIAVLGCGRIGAMHAANIAAHPSGPPCGGAGHQWRGSQLPRPPQAHA